MEAGLWLWTIGRSNIYQFSKTPYFEDKDIRREPAACYHIFCARVHIDMCKKRDWGNSPNTREECTTALRRVGMLQETLSRMVMKMEMLIVVILQATAC